MLTTCQDIHTQRDTHRGRGHGGARGTWDKGETRVTRDQGETLEVAPSRVIHGRYVHVRTSVGVLFREQGPESNPGYLAAVHEQTTPEPQSSDLVSVHSGRASKAESGRGQ